MCASNFDEIHQARIIVILLLPPITWSIILDSSTHKSINWRYVEAEAKDKQHE